MIWPSNWNASKKPKSISRGHLRPHHQEYGRFGKGTSRGTEAIVGIHDTLNEQLQLHELNSQDKKTILTTLNKNLYQLYSIGQIAKTNSSLSLRKRKRSVDAAPPKIVPGLSTSHKGLTVTTNQEREKNFASASAFRGPYMMICWNGYALTIDCRYFAPKRMA